MTKDEAIEVVRGSYRDVAAEAGFAVPTDIDESTPLVGPDTSLDSMGLVSVILDVEQRLEEQHGLAISLMDEQALSRSRSPFRTVGTLADLILESLASLPPPDKT